MKLPYRWKSLTMSSWYTGITPIGGQANNAQNGANRNRLCRQQTWSRTVSQRPRNVVTGLDNRVEQQHQYTYVYEKGEKVTSGVNFDNIKET